MVLDESWFNVEPTVCFHRDAGDAYVGVRLLRLRHGTMGHGHEWYRGDGIAAALCHGILIVVGDQRA